MSEIPASVQRAVRIAYRFFGELSLEEQETILAALIESSNGPEAAAANDALYHRRKERDAQLTLRAIMDGIGAPQSALRDPHS